VSETPPGTAVSIDDQLAAGLLPERPVRGHKGTFGKLLVIAGSLDYAGAALLVCAATRAGAGPDARRPGAQPLFAAKVVEATTMAFPEVSREVDPEPALAKIPTTITTPSSSGRPPGRALTETSSARSSRCPATPIPRRPSLMRRRSGRSRRTAGEASGAPC
jgi:NAD(P)H-hydrate epimerase